MLRLSLDFKLVGEWRPFHFPEDSALLGAGLIVDIRCVGKDCKKVHVLEADDISRSMAATNTESTENTSIASSDLGKWGHFNQPVLLLFLTQVVSVFLKRSHRAMPDNLSSQPKDVRGTKTRTTLTFLVLLFCGFLSFLKLEEIKDRVWPSGRVAWLTRRAAGACGWVGISRDQLVHLNPNLEPEEIICF